MTNDKPKTFDDCESIEECDALLRDQIPSLMTYKVAIWTNRWGSRELECNSQEDAVEMARAISKYLRARLGDVPNYEDGNYWFEWTVQVWGMVASRPEFLDYEDYRNRPAASWTFRRFVCAYEPGKVRVAHPASKVFFVVGGRDCDGYYGEELFEANTFETAQKLLDQSQESADGPQGWSCITKEEYETRTRESE